MSQYKKEWSRRNFLTTLAATSTAIALNPFNSWAFDETDPRVAAIVAKTLGIDTHNHIDVPLNADELPGPKVDLAGELKKSGLAAICMTFAVDYQQLRNPGEAYEHFLNGLKAMDKLLKNNKIRRSFNLTDLEAARKSGKPTVIQSVEGAHFLEGKLDRLEVAYKRGLRHLGLLHDNDASVPLGDNYTKIAQWGGLTAFGSDVIKESNKLGILVDLAHCNNETIDMALKVATKPVLISHTGLNTQLGKKEFMAKMMMPRLISKEQAKIVADAGGVIGVWTHLAETPLEFAENIRALVDVIGVDHVGIGTDTKLTPGYRSPNDRRPGQGDPPNGTDGPGKEGGGGNFGNRPDSPPRNEQGQRGTGAPAGGERKQGNRVGERTNEAWQDQKTGFYYTVVEALLKTGFNEEEIGKIGGENYCRLFDAATKGD